MLSDSSPIHLHPSVEEAIQGGSPVVALESTIISHGLPRPENIRVAREIESIVAANGATPATIAILDGEIYVGLTNDQLESIANRDDVVKASVRDLPVVLARSGTATTTVAATSIIAQRVGNLRNVLPPTSARSGRATTAITTVSTPRAPLSRRVLTVIEHVEELIE